MIGDAYFHLRAQIGTSLFSLAKLARDLEAPDDALGSLHDLQGELRTPFLFVALGEQGAGKSTLLNALFGRDFAGDAALGGRAAVYRHANEASDQLFSDDLVEAVRPHIFLRDFTIVDAAGLGSLALRQQFVPAADVVLFVFTPQGGTPEAWEYLQQVDRAQIGRFVFLIQQADAVEGDDLMNAVLTLHDRLRETLGETPPLFAVSATTRAGVDQLERHLDHQVIGCAQRFAKLREICVSADALLFHLGGATRAAAEAAEGKTKFAEEQRHVLDGVRDEALRVLDRDLWSLSQVFDAALRRGGELLRRRVSHHSLWAAEMEWQETFHREVETRVREGLLRQVELAAEHCDTALRTTWEAQRTELAECGAPTLAAFPEDAAAHLERLRRGITAADPDGVTTAAVLARWRRSRVLLRLPFFVLIASGLALVAAWFTGRQLLAASSVFACAFAATVFVPALLRNSLGNALLTAMRARREAILARVEADMRSEFERVFRDLQGSLAPVARAGADERVANQPLLDRILQLAEHFDHLIAEIEAHETRAAEPELPLPEAAA